MRWLGLPDIQRHLIGDRDAVSFESDNFFGMVREHANIFQSEINEDLRADAAFVLHHALTRRFAIKLATRMNVNLGKLARFLWLFNAETAACMMQIEENASLFFGNGFEGPRDKILAIARCRAKNVSR